MSDQTLAPNGRSALSVQPYSVLKKLGTSSLLSAAVMAASASMTVQAAEFLDGRAELNYGALQGFQAIQAKDGAFRPGDEEQSEGFNRLRVNLWFKFHITDYITADVDVAEEPNDFGNNGDRDFSFHQDFAGIEFDLLGMMGMGRDRADSLQTPNGSASSTGTSTDLTLRIGNIGAAPFQFKGFQDGADNQGNALIGNGITDYATAENGMQLSYSMSSETGAIRGFNIVGHITTSAFGEQFQEDRGWNFRLGGSLEFGGGFKAGVNFFQANQGDQLDFIGGVASMDGVTTTNYRFGDGDNYNFSASGSSDRETHVMVMPGLDQSTMQLNVAYQPSPNTSLIFMLGESSDDFTFSDAAGNPVAGFKSIGGGETAANVIEGDTSVEYFVVEAQQYLVPEKFYLAARYSEAENTSDLIEQSDNTVERLQVAAGWWVANNTLWKFEYVDQDEGANSGGGIGAGFDGFISELSVKF